MTGSNSSSSSCCCSTRAVVYDRGNHGNMMSVTSALDSCCGCNSSCYSSHSHRLIVPRCRLNMYGCRAFPVAGPMVWNSLPDELRDPACDIDSFKQFFKTILLSQY